MFSQIQTVLLSFVFGACIGSFLNVLIWRLPREGKANGRSKCVACGKQLGWHELVPILSFAVQIGKCRSCGINISFRYPIIELSTAILFAVTSFLYPPHDILSSLIYIKLLYVVAIAVLVFVVDLEHQLILNRVILPSSIIVLGLNLLITTLEKGGGFSISGVFWGGIIAGLSAMAPFWLIWRISEGRWMGFGDIKLMGFIGLVLGPINTVVAFFVAVFTGTLTSAFLILFRNKNLKSAVPFGTFLAVGLIAALWWGDVIGNWYWRLIWPY